MLIIFRSIRFRDIEIVSLVKKRKIDIAIDLMGYTNIHVQIFSIKLAPLQINYGYAGTTGTNYMDYIVEFNFNTRQP